MVSKAVTKTIFVFKKTFLFRLCPWNVKKCGKNSKVWFVECMTKILDEPGRYFFVSCFYNIFSITYLIDLKLLIAQLYQMLLYLTDWFAEMEKYWKRLFRKQGTKKLTERLPREMEQVFKQTSTPRWSANNVQTRCNTIFVIYDEQNSIYQYIWFLYSLYSVCFFF